MAKKLALKYLEGGVSIDLEKAAKEFEETRDEAWKEIEEEYKKKDLLQWLVIVFCLELLYQDNVQKLIASLKKYELDLYIPEESLFEFHKHIEKLKKFYGQEDRKATSNNSFAFKQLQQLLLQSE